jgi:beta-ketoacyl synthase-like protein
VELTLAGQAVLGPGLPDWTTARAVLCGGARYAAGNVPQPAPELLPPNERRRASCSARWALTVGQHALGARLEEARDIATVFTSCGGDGVITNQICEVLASAPTNVSPTAFHNSVHNAPAGYWSIATQCRAPSTSLCAYSGSFGAGLLEAATQVFVEGRSVLLVAYDLPFPAPMHPLWPILHPFAAALLLDPAGAAGTAMRVKVRDGAAQLSWPPTLPKDLATNPAAHALALLEGPACGQKRSVDLPFTSASHVVVEIG